MGENALFISSKKDFTRASTACALPPLSVYHLHRSAPVNDALPGLDVFVVREFEKAAIIWEGEIRNAIYSAALSRPDQAHSPRHLQRLADND